MMRAKLAQTLSASTFIYMKLGDLKPANILLDFNLNPRLSGGMERTLPPKISHATPLVPAMDIAGTNGFLDEFYRNTGQYDAKSDAYSMGVTLLIILTGFPVFHERLGYIVRRCEVEGNSVMTIADPSAQWPQEVAREMHKVAMSLVIEPDRDARMSVSNARDAVQRLVARHLPPAPVLEGIEVERVRVICMSEPRYFRFGECGHSVLCRGCMGDLMRRARPQCPNCRTPVSRELLIQGDNVASEDTFIQPRAEAAVVVATADVVELLLSLIIMCKCDLIYPSM
jgi:serine/threonine protein kinase